MPLPRYPWALTALALTLVLGACSTPADLSAPTLEPQFGTSDNDFGVDVAHPVSGRVYVLSEREGSYYGLDGEEDGIENIAVLSRYDGNGNFVWSRDVDSSSCPWYADCYDDSLTTRVLAVDRNGYLYALTSRSGVYEDSQKIVYFEVTKLDASGNRVRSFSVGNTGYGFWESASVYENAADMSVDASGNVYVVRVQYDYDADGGTRTNVVTKYTTSGAQQWQRVLTVGLPYGVAVSSNGLIYVGGSTGVAKYTTSGDLVRKIASGDTRDVAAVGTNTVYARNLTTVRKLDANGKQLWSKTQTGLSGVITIADMTTDSSANVYITGKYGPSSNRDGFVRRLAASNGATTFSKTVATPAYDDARGVATLNGSEVYLTGATQSPLAPPYDGRQESNDGYLRKLISSGNPVWTR